MTTPFRHNPHRRTTDHKNKAVAPVVVADQLATVTPYERFNAKLALRITGAIGSMTCAYAFAALALVSLPAAILTHSLIVIVAWIAQTFLQLVLLSIILVGQGASAQAADKRAQDTFVDAEAVLHEALEIQRHLKSQDAVLRAQDAILAGLVKGGTVKGVAKSQ